MTKTELETALAENVRVFYRCTSNEKRFRLRKERQSLREELKWHCTSCAKSEIVSHEGSPLCESGSLASGGHRSHCTCDVCF